MSHQSSEQSIDRTNQLMNQAIEMQQNALRRGQNAMEEAVEIPLRQSIQLQKSGAELLLNGLDISNWFQNRGIELTRDTLSTYIDTVDNAAQTSAELATESLEQTSHMGQAGIQQADQGRGQRRQQVTTMGQQGFEQANQVGQPTFQPQQQELPVGNGQQMYQSSQHLQQRQQPPQQMQQPPQQMQQPTQQLQQPPQQMQQPTQQLQQPPQQIQQPTQQLQQPPQQRQQPPQQVQQPSQAAQQPPQTTHVQPQRPPKEEQSKEESKTAEAPVESS